jgi:hypothetical protein
VKPQVSDNENDRTSERTDGCSVCRELLANLGRFIEMIEAVRASPQGEWLTVDEVAGELKLSKSIIYRLIRSGELEAVDLVAQDTGKAPQKGHFRIRRSALTRYLEDKRVKPLPDLRAHLPARRFPKVKNHLGL